MLKQFYMLGGLRSFLFLFSYLLFPFVTRNYHPEVYGAWVTWYGITVTASSVFTLGLEQALGVEPQQYSQWQIFKVALLSAALFSLTSFLISWLGLPWLVTLWPQLYNQTLAILTLPLSIFTYSIFILSQSLLLANDRLVLRSFLQCLSAVLTPLLQLVIPFFLTHTFNLASLLFASVASATTCILLSHISLNHATFKNNISLNDIDSILQTLLSYKAYPVYVMPSSFLSTLKDNLFMFILGSQSLSLVACFQLALTIVKVPDQLLTPVLRPIYLSWFKKTSSFSKSEFPAFFNQFLLKSIPIFLPLIICFSSQTTKIVFGDSWSSSYVYLCLLLPFAVVRLSTNYLDSAIYLFHRQKLFFSFELLCVFLNGSILLLLSFSSVSSYTICIVQAAFLFLYALFYSVLIYQSISYDYLSNLGAISRSIILASVSAALLLLQIHNHMLGAIALAIYIFFTLCLLINLFNSLRGSLSLIMTP